jgi:hypothetical protein
LGGAVVKTNCSDLMRINDTISPMLSAKHPILVTVHPDNGKITYYDEDGIVYSVYTLNSECKKLGVLLGKIAVIHPLIKKGDEGV